MLLRSITLKNLLSFKDATLELRPLNVLIGANGSGKSNLIDAISLLQGAPRNLASAMQRGDGVQGWLRKTDPPPEFAGLQCEIEDGRPNASLDYTLHFKESNYALSIQLESLARRSGSERTSVFSRSGRGYTVGNLTKPRLPLPIEPTESMLVHRGGLTLGEVGGANIVPLRFTAIRIYREFSTAPNSRIRRGSTTDAMNDFLSEDGTNLAMVLSQLNLETGLGDINRRFQRFYELAQEVVPAVHGGVAQIYVRPSVPTWMRQLPRS